MRRPPVRIACVTLTAGISVAASAGGPDKAGDAGTALDPRLAGLAWMQGAWTRSDGGETLEEVWSAPAGDSMMGMFRWSRQDKVWLFELITITVEDGDIVFRLKHFDRKLVGWEEKDEALTYKLVHYGQREAIFENSERDHPRQIIYRSPDANTLFVRLEGRTDGKPDVTEFRFRRAAAPND